MNLTEIEQRCDMATNGPWEKSIYDRENGLFDYLITHLTPSEDDYYVVIREHSAKMLADSRGGQDEKDLSFIAHARTDLPEAIRLLREAREIISLFIGFKDPASDDEVVWAISRAEAFLTEVQDYSPTISEMSGSIPGIGEGEE